MSHSPTKQPRPDAADVVTPSHAVTSAGTSPLEAGISPAQPTTPPAPTSESPPRASTPLPHLLLPATPTGRLLLVLALTSLAGLSMLAFRMYYGGTRGYRALPWDLFLAWLPVPLAFATLRAHARSGPASPKTVALFVAWLLFFPNAPYLLTQFMHLHPSYAVSERPLPPFLAQFSPGRPIPLWFDVLMLSTFAWTGLLLGFASLHALHRAAARRLGPLAGWSAAVLGLGLCAFGISLGRFQRWNSWDVLTQPLALSTDIASRIFNPLSHPRTAATTVGFAAFLLLAYLSLIALIRLGWPADGSTDDETRSARRA